MDTDISIQCHLDYLSNDKDIVLLGSNSTHKIQIFHNPWNLGGLVMRKFDKIGCLIDLGLNVMCIEIHNILASMSKIEFCMPTLHKLEGSSDAKMIKDLENRNNWDSVTCSGTIFLFVAL